MSRDISFILLVQIIEFFLINSHIIVYRTAKKL